MTTAHKGAAGATGGAPTAAAPQRSLLGNLETGAVNFGAGILNTFENIGTQLGTVASTVAAGKTTTTDGQALPSVTTTGSNDPASIQGAFADVTKLVADAKSGSVISSVEDGVKLATDGYALLSGWGINLTALGPFVSMLQKVEAFAPLL